MLLNVYKKRHRGAKDFFEIVIFDLSSFESIEEVSMSFILLISEI
jgi:hypothetical protein